MQQRARNALERQKDRQDDEGQVDHRHGDQYGALVEQENLARLFENAEAQQHLADEPVQAEHGAQGIELDDVAHEQRHDREQEQEVAAAALLRQMNQAIG